MSYYVRDKNHKVEMLQDICIITTEEDGKKTFIIGGRSPISQTKLWRLTEK